MADFITELNDHLVNMVGSLRMHQWVVGVRVLAQGNGPFADDLRC